MLCRHLSEVTEKLHVKLNQDGAGLYDGNLNPFPLEYEAGEQPLDLSFRCNVKCLQKQSKLNVIAVYLQMKHSVVNFHLQKKRDTPLDCNLKNLFTSTLLYNIYNVLNFKVLSLIFLLSCVRLLRHIINA
jgi:hypothetical protein